MWASKPADSGLVLKLVRMHTWKMPVTMTEHPRLSFFSLWGWQLKKPTSGHLPRLCWEYSFPAEGNIYVLPPPNLRLLQYY